MNECKNFNLFFVDSYWELCSANTDKRISSVTFSNCHFKKLNSYLLQEIASPGIAEDKIKTRYRKSKRWDMHFVEKKILIEYKSMTDTEHIRGNNIHKSAYSRIEEAIGNAFDVKREHPDYKLGFIIILFMRNKENFLKQKPAINHLVRSFDTMVKDNLYDFFCPVISFGKGNHEELSNEYTFERFIIDIKNTQAIDTTPMSAYLQE